MEKRSQWQFVDTGRDTWGCGPGHTLTAVKPSPPRSFALSGNVHPTLRSTATSFGSPKKSAGARRN